MSTIWVCSASLRDILSECKFVTDVPLFFYDKHLKLAIVVPVTAWSSYWEKNPFFVALKPNTNNRLKKKSVVDCFQIRAVSHNRFAEMIGEISNDEIDQIKRSITLILDIEPEHCEE